MRARVPRRRVRDRRRAPARAPGHLRVAAAHRRAARSSRSASPTSSRSRASSACSRPRAFRRAAAIATSAIRSSSPAARSRSRTRCRSPAIVDAIVVGEAGRARRRRRCAPSRARPPRAAQLDALAEIPHVFVPTHHAVLPPVGAEDDAMLPAYSAIRTPHTELSDMFLIETERGCSRGCSYCVMRRSTNGGMRIVPAEVVLETIPSDAQPRGPRRRGGERPPEDRRRSSTRSPTAGARWASRRCAPTAWRRTKASSRRSPRVGYRTLTTAMDGTSERVRETLDRRARPKHLHRVRRAREEARDGPAEALLDDRHAGRDRRRHRRVRRVHDRALADRPARPRHRALLRQAKHAARRRSRSRASASSSDRLDRLRRGLAGAPTCARRARSWAWVEYVLAQGGEAEGLAVIDAVTRAARSAPTSRRSAGARRRCAGGRCRSPWGRAPGRPGADRDRA